MKKKRILILMLILFFSFRCLLFSESFKVSEKEAYNYAKNWLNFQLNVLKDQYKIQGLRWKIVSMSIIKEKGEVLAYNFSLFPAGHILVSGYKFLTPIKMYSFSSPLENSNLFPLVKTLFYKFIEKTKVMKNDEIVKMSNHNIKKWKNLNKQLYAPLVKVTVKGPFLKTRWAQGYPYNKFTPIINGKRTFAGCVAVAIAQIMKYWNYPKKGQGSVSYSTPTYNINVNFEHEYKWEDMPNMISNNSEPSQIDAVARLIFEVGVANNTKYGVWGSIASASSPLHALPFYFKYSDFIDNHLYEEYMNLHKWFNLIKKELDSTPPRPVNLHICPQDGACHSVVVDGYKIDGDDEYFHVNMGWGGSYDGYYKPNNIQRFNKIEWERAIIKIYPSIFDIPDPPENIKANRVARNFLLYSSYFDIITWEDSPSKNISEYRVYQKKGTEEKVIAVVKVGNPKYIMIPVGIKREKIEYTVTAVGDKGVESKKPDYVMVY